MTSDASDGVRGDTSDGVRGEGADIWSRSDREEECMNCGRHIRGRALNTSTCVCSTIRFLV